MWMYVRSTGLRRILNLCSQFIEYLKLLSKFTTSLSGVVISCGGEGEVGGFVICGKERNLGP
jgi:hypothetical protein